MKNITFNEQMNLFFEKEAKETLGMWMQELACMRSHDACARMVDSRSYISFLH